MSKPELYVVKTNYDLDGYWTEKPLPEVLAKLSGVDKRYIVPDMVTDLIMGKHVLRVISGGPGFRETVGRVMPSVELRRRYINRHLKDGLEFTRLGGDIGFDDLVRLIQFEDGLRGYARGELPQDFTHFRLVVDFYSNLGLHDASLKRLEEVFDVHRLVINRPDSHPSFS